MNLQTIIKNIQEIKKERTILTSSIYAQSELGELSDEVLKSINQSTKPGGEDGVFGEAIDVIICMLDIIQLDNPNITEYEILNKISQKVDKWAVKSYNDYGTMDINTLIGRKVIFQGIHGLDFEIEFAKTLLEVGKKYTICDIEIGNWNTNIYLEEIDNFGFNSVMFSNV